MPILNLDRIVVSVEEMKDYLRIDNDLDNPMIEDFINGAKEQADNYMQNDFTTIDETTGELVLTPIPLSVYRAVKSLVAYWYYNREDFVSSENAGTYTKGKAKDVPMNFYNLLWAYRKEPWL
jgi:hypothetical protein